MLNPLYAKFETDSKKESDGVWFEYDIGEGDKNPRFLARRFNQRDKAFRVNSRKNVKPYSMILGKAPETPEEEVEAESLQEDITLQTFVETFLLGWENIADRECNPIEFSVKNACEFLKNFRDLYIWLVNKTSDRDNYRHDIAKAEIKNS